jgi:acyl-CoA thioester hydrolase
MFKYRHKVQFYETDLMGIVHHSNYLRIFEEARVAWAHDRGLIDYQKPESASHLAVIETKVSHLSPAKFGDDLLIELQVKKEKARIRFFYRMSFEKRILSECETWHAALDQNLKVMRPPKLLAEILEKESWIEI